MSAPVQEIPRLDENLEEELKGACVSSTTIMNSMMDATMELTDSEVFFDAAPQTNFAALIEAARLSNRADALKLRFVWGCFEDPAFARPDEFGELTVAPEAIAAVLGTSPFVVGRLKESADILYVGMPGMTELFHNGDIGLGTVRAVTQKLVDYDYAVWLAVDIALATNLVNLTPASAAREVDRLLIELAPDNTDSLHGKNSISRGVSRPRATKPGMGRLIIDASAEQCVAIDTALDDAARKAISAGDCRSYQQLRADFLVEVITRMMRDGFQTTTDCGEPLSIPPTKVVVTVPLEVLARANPEFDPHPSVAEALHREEFWDEEVVGGRIEAPWLEGWGPLTPAIAILLAAGGTWQRIVTDTFSGKPLDVGRQRYRPPENIASAVRRRDRFCRTPGCNRERNLDMDHIIEWQHGGSTSVDNLQLLCRRCHRLKSVGLTRVKAEEPSGARLWEIGGVERWEVPRGARRARYLTPQSIKLPDPGPPPF